MSYLFKKTVLLLISTGALTSPQSLASESDSIKMKVYCLSNEKPIPLCKQTIAANIFAYGFLFKQTDAFGILQLNSTFLNRDFRLNGFANGNIIPRCNSGTIKKIEDHLKVTVFGLDCGAIEGCD